MRYFPGKAGFLIAMTAAYDFRPTRDIVISLYIDECFYPFREQELFLDLVGCLDADV